MKDVNQQKLESFQIVNHFSKQLILTTKNGLTHTLKNVSAYTQSHSDFMFPRCFDCLDEHSFEDFLVYYK